MRLQSEATGEVRTILGDRLLSLTHPVKRLARDQQHGLMVGLELEIDQHAAPQPRRLGREVLGSGVRCLAVIPEHVVDN